MLCKALITGVGECGVVESRQTDRQTGKETGRSGSVGRAIVVTVGKDRTVGEMGQGM